MKRYLPIIMILGLWSCTGPEDPNSQEEHSGESSAVPAKPVVISAAIQPYSMADGSKVNSIRVRLANPSDPAQVQYYVELVQGDRSWKDTLSLFMGRNDTIGGDMIFPESEVDSLQPASFSGKLVVIEEEPS